MFTTQRGNLINLREWDWFEIIEREDWVVERYNVPKYVVGGNKGPLMYEGKILWTQLMFGGFNSREESEKYLFNLYQMKRESNGITIDINPENLPKS